MKPYNKPYVKSVSFYHDRLDDMELHLKLSELPHGEFQNETKRMWKERLEKAEETNLLCRDKRKRPDIFRLS